VTYLSNYSPDVVPDAATHYSLLAEVSRSPYKPVNLENVVEEVLDGLVNTRLLSPDDLSDVVDTHLIVREHTYPVPALRRDEALAAILPRLEARGIYSRGRFGAWKYEVGNMDHAVQMGVECIDRVLRGRPEECVNNRIRPKPDQDLKLIATTAEPTRTADAFQVGLRAAVSRPHPRRRQSRRKAGVSASGGQSRGGASGNASRGRRRSRD
jgi:hypothetical protein